MSSALLSTSNASNVMSLGQTTLAGRHDTVRAILGGGVAEVRLNRPAKLNALNLEMFDDLLEVGLMLRGDPTVRAVVLTGEGRAFCSGLDYAVLAELENDANEQGYTPGDELLAPDDQLLELSRSQRAACVWGTVPAPVIAALNGPAFGGGLQLALPADIRIVAPETILSVAEVRWGLTPDMAGTQLLPRLVGMDVAMELTLTGQVITGEEALRIGLATRVDDDPRDAAMMLAREIAKRNPDAVRTAKSLLDSAWHVSMGDGLAAERQAAELIARSPNQREAMRARLARRTPNFADSPQV